MKFPNPLLPGFHPDPSIVRVDDDYYLVTSTMEYLPGFPIYRGRGDLFEWEHIGNVADRPGQLDLDGTPTGGGGWAPTIRHRDGTFYVVVTDRWGRGTLLFTAADPAGPWSDGIVLDLDNAIDPDITWTDDGTCLLTYAVLPFGGGEEGIFQAALDPESGALLEAPRRLWSGTGMMLPEAPHLYRRNGWWYLVIAEGGTARGHSVSVARSRRPDGAFEPAPHNPILTARSSDQPVQNVGHADFVETQDGDWFAVVLGSRIRGMMPGFSALGRETYATSIAWHDDWPHLAQIELAPQPEAVQRWTPDPSGLGPEWLGVRRLPTEFTEVVDGRLLVHADGASLDDPTPTFVGRRERHLTSRTTACLDVSRGEGGLVLRFREGAWCEIGVHDERLVATVSAAGLRQQWLAESPVTDVVHLTIRTRRPRGNPFNTLAPDFIDLAVEVDGEPEVVATIDGRLLSAEFAASMSGRIIGVAATSGVIGVDWIDTDGDDS
ncbi:glycoside hydrolase family 43 protein [Gulosibacter faecalis]|jgi:hypothetical protein|uniref:Family 43 glycosylhydrolase n=1 Tax=Gulosibacter faecalis TaxID=272240 RepID=A0ABW5V3S2_9MICO|nr:glycoside hydrolase family 43 protein [Gulosibacter faecalis]